MDAILIIKDFTLTQWLILIPLLFLGFFTFQWKWYQKKNRKIIEIASKLPIPVPSNIIFGTWYNPKSSTYIPTYTGEDFVNAVTVAMKVAAAQPYSAFCMWAGPVPQILVQKPGDAQRVLNSSKALEKGPEYKFSKFAFGEGLLTAPAKKWKISRRYINPVFHKKNLSHLTSAFNQLSHQLVEDMAHHVTGEPFDVFHPLLKATVSSVSGILFGLEGRSKMENNDFQLGASITLRTTEFTAERMVTPWLWSDRIFDFIYKKKLEDLEKTWIRFFKKPMSITENVDMLTVPKVYTKLLQEHSTTFCEDDMHADMKTILVAGSETTAVNLSCCLVILGTHPEIQEKLYQEIFNSLGPEDRDITNNDLNALPYLDQVIKESLRISTTLIGIKRTFSEDIKLRECTIPKGGSVVISINGLHFDPEVYPDPNVFKPERFTPENAAKRHPYSFLPFGGGPRNCIGKQYAMISMKIMLAYIVRRYKISATEGILDLRYSITITLKSINGYKISLETRNK